MSIREKLEDLSNRYHPKGGEWAGEDFTIYRPVISGTQVLYRKIGTGSWRFEDGTKGGPMPNIPGVQYSYGFGVMDGVVEGDLFVGPPDHPSLTYMQYHRMTDMNLFRTDRLGSFMLDVNTAYLTQVRYEWLMSASPIQELTDVLMGQLDKSIRRLVCWAHEPLIPHNKDMKGMHFIETDGTLVNQKRYIVKMAQYMRPLLLFTVQEE